MNYVLFKTFSVFLFLLIGFRDEVGGDWYNYQYMYEQIAGLSWLQSLSYTEPGYALINWWANYFGLSIHVVNACCALIFTWGLGKFCLSLPQPWLALLIAVPYLISAVAMGYTRQSAAIGFALFGLVSLFKKETWGFIFFVLVGVLFHRSVIVMLILFPLTRQHLKFGQVIITASFVAIIFFVCFFLMPDRLMSMWELYISQGMTSDGSLFRVLLNVVPAILFFMNRKIWKAKWPEHYDLMLWFSIFSFISLPLQFLISTAIDRVLLYVIPFQIMFFSSFPLLIYKEQRYICILGIIFYYCIVYFTWLFFSYWAQCCWIPYKNVFF